MNRSTRIFVRRCTGGNVAQIIQSCQLRPKTDVTHSVYISVGHRKALSVLNSHRQYSYKSAAAKFSTISSTNINSESTVQSTSTSTTEPNGDTATKETVPLTFIESDGTERLVQAEVGKHLLDVAHDNHVELEGACGGELSCSTCHLIFEPHVYEKLTPKLDDEQDMLDLAFGVTETSRLGCQIRVTRELEGIKVQIPDDGF